MDTIIVSKNYLETLSTADLIALADDYGIDIPEKLNRRFIIGELLEAIEEFQEEKPETLQETDSVIEGSELPASYNETMITAILRNPAWAYVYWDISTNDLERIQVASNFSSLVLKLCFFSKDDSEKPIETFDVSVNETDRDQYVLLPTVAYSLQINLFAEYKNALPDCLARSKVIVLPEGYPELGSAILNGDSSEIEKLSGFNELIRTHYINHRQSFS